MKDHVVLISLTVIVNLVNVNAQFGFFQRRDGNQSPFNLAGNFLPRPNRLRDGISGLFNLRPERPRPAIITDQDREQGDQPYYPNQNNFNRPVLFPTTSPDERPVDMYYPREDTNQYNPNWQNRPIENPNNQQYPENEPNNGNTNQEYTERPVSFPAAEPSSPSSGYDNNVNTGLGDEGQNQEGNGETTQYEQEKGQSSNTFNQDTASATEPIANNDYTTKSAGFEEVSGTEKYQDRFGTDTGPLPNLADTPNYETKGSNFGPSGFFTDTCQTVENEVGSCINLKQCEPYLKILQQQRNNPGAVQLLRKAHCGFDGNDPKVCCPRPGFSTVAPITRTTTTQAPSTTTTTQAPAPVSEGSVKTIGPEDFVLSFPEPPVCGVSNASFSRVVGGVDAKLGDFPWMALLGYRKRNNPTQWLCGGSLITSKHVLTAAHCIHTKENELYLVRLGELDIIRDDEGAAPVDIFIKHLIKHEDYSPKAYTNDIAIIVLEKEAEFTDMIRPICLPQAAELRATSFEDYTPMVAGWGNIEARGPSATVLQVVQLPVVSNDFCKQAYRNYTQQKIDERVLCAGYKKGGKDSCRGDSGGPLMQPIWNNKSFKTYFFQIGVVSFGKGCAEAGFPGVYSRVTHFIPWLQQKVLGQA